MQVAEGFCVSRIWIMTFSSVASAWHKNPARRLTLHSCAIVGILLNCLEQMAIKFI